MNNVLASAILSLDSYNRGYGEAIKLQIKVYPTCPDRTQERFLLYKTLIPRMKLMQHAVENRRHK
jgi:hypothetical protein